MRTREGGGRSERPLGPEAERGLGAGGLLERRCPQPERSLTSGTGRGRARVLTEGHAESGPAALWSCLYECRRGGEAEGEPLGPSCALVCKNLIPLPPGCPQRIPCAAPSQACCQLGPEAGGHSVVHCLSGPAPTSLQAVLGVGHVRTGSIKRPEEVSVQPNSPSPFSQEPPAHGGQRLHQPLP